MRRLAECFLHKRGQQLADYGFSPDPGQIRSTDADTVVFYHYTQPQALAPIFAPGSGLRARLPVVHMDVAPELRDCYLVEGLLDPLPNDSMQVPISGIWAAN